MIFEHKSVLLYETVDSLNIKPDGIYVDGTLGGGGHAFEVASRLGENGRLIGIDQDADAIKAATEPNMNQIVTSVGVAASTTAIMTAMASHVQNIGFI